MTSPIDLASGDPSAHRDHRSDAFPIAGSNRASKMPRRKRRTRHVTIRQATKLIEALEFAEAINLRLNVAIDICWSLFSGFTDDQERIARFQERLSKWCKRQGFQLAMIWVREMGKYVVLWDRLALDVAFEELAAVEDRPNSFDAVIENLNHD